MGVIASFFYLLLLLSTLIYSPKSLKSTGFPLFSFCDLYNSSIRAAPYNVNRSIDRGAPGTYTKFSVEGYTVTFQEAFPAWDKLSTQQQDQILNSLLFRAVKKGTVLHNGDADCTGLLLVKSGQLRAYILSDEGREITIYRLFDRDLGLFSASCMMRFVQFDVTIQAEKDTELWIIPADVYQSVMEASAPVSNYTNELMASRFSEVVWLMEQSLWKSMDKRAEDHP